jgi:hypothetical protein
VTCAEAVCGYLLTLSPVTALVNQRIWTLRFPQSPTKPAVLVQHVSDVTEMHLRGASGLQRARIQIDVIAATIVAARAVDAAIVGDFTGGSPTGLKGFTGDIGSPAFSIKFARPIAYRELYDGDELKQARVMRDWEIHYED